MAAPQVSRLSAGLAFAEHPDPRHPGLEYLQRLEQRFQLVARLVGVRELVLAIAGEGVRLRLAGERLAEALTPALSHHPVALGAPPSATICAFDLATSGTPAPPFPWAASDIRERGEIRGFNDRHVRTLYDSGPGVLSMLDVDRRYAILAVTDARRIPASGRAAPLRTIFHWQFGSATRLLAHAAAVGSVEHGGLILAGAGGSGKSTTAVACAAAGMRYLGDDYVLLETAGEPVVHSLYQTAKLTDASLALLPALERLPRSSAADERKRVLDLSRAFPGCVVERLPVRAIVLPQLSDRGETQLTPASPAAALRALAPTTIFQLPSNGGVALAQLARLARRVPAYRLQIRRGAPRVGAVAQLLERIRR